MLTQAAILSSELAVCLWIPLFPLRCEEQRRPELSGRPTALLSPSDTRRLWQISPTARRVGVRPGMTVSQAIGLCPTLTLCKPDPVHYDEQFTSVLLALNDVSPVIEPAELGRAFIGVDGLERLHGDPARQLRVIARVAGKGEGGNGKRTAVGQRGGAVAPQRSGVAAKRKGHRSPNVSRFPLPPSRCPVPGGVELGCGWTDAARLGWGRGKFLSWVAATRAKPGNAVIVSDEERREFLSGQPVAVLPISSDTHRRLWQLGLKTLADVARLPQVALVSQFGAEGRTAWQLATGSVTDPVTGKERPEPITASLDFPTPAADRAMLAHALNKLIERALGHPRRTGWRVHVVRARAALEHGTSWMTEVTLRDPSADRARIAAPLEVRLENTPPTGAVERLTVEFIAFARGTDELQLFARDASAAARAGRRSALYAAAHEIQTRLKRTMLSHIIEVQPWSRIPERRYALIDFEP